MSNLTGWELVGYLPVDAGIMMLGDPCYVLSRKEYNDEGFDYEELLSQIDYKTKPPVRVQMVQPSNYFSPTSLIFETGFGDGSYAVYVRYSDEREWGKRVAQVKVVFITDENEEICSACGADRLNCMCDEFDFGNYCDWCNEHEDSCICDEEVSR